MDKKWVVYSRQWCVAHRENGIQSHSNCRPLIWVMNKVNRWYDCLQKQSKQKLKWPPSVHFFFFSFQITDVDYASTISPIMNVWQRWSISKPNFASAPRGVNVIDLSQSKVAQTGISLEGTVCAKLSCCTMRGEGKAKGAASYPCEIPIILPLHEAWCAA